MVVEVTEVVIVVIVVVVVVVVIVVVVVVVVVFVVLRVVVVVEVVEFGVIVVDFTSCKVSPDSSEGSSGSLDTRSSLCPLSPNRRETSVTKELVSTPSILDGLFTGCDVDNSVTVPLNNILMPCFASSEFVLVAAADDDVDDNGNDDVVEYVEYVDDDDNDDVDWVLVDERVFALEALG